METTNAVQDFLVTGCLFPFATPYGKGIKKRYVYMVQSGIMNYKGQKAGDGQC
jgi:hypothetical protein